MTIAVQLYTVRDALAQDFTGTVRKIAAIGYQGVETAGEYGGSPEKAAALFKELGLKVVAAHGPLPIGENKNRVLDTLAALGTQNAVLAWISPDYFQTLDGIKVVCDQLNEADANARPHGVRIHYHNHHFEYVKMADGSIPALHMLDFLEPTVMFEVDTYWAQTGGADVVEVLKKLDDRASLLHIKDGPAVLNEPMVAVGDGVMDFKAILTVSKAEAHIVELDSCATDMLEAVSKSFGSLKTLLS
jgi:sugar phosphate isomerase/epimerase